MNTEPAATLVVEYPCDRHCRAELDLNGVHNRFTYGQMLRAVDDYHQRLHTTGQLEVSAVGGAIVVVGAPSPADPLGVGGSRV